MRIFCAVRHSTDPNFYYGALWSRNFYPALRQLGHEIIESQTDLFATSRFMHIASDFTREETDARAHTTEAILEEVRTAHKIKPIDLFLSYFYNAHFDPAGFAGLRQLGIPTVNFYCNSIYQFDLVRDIAAGVNFSWYTERDARALYLSVGANPVRVQMGADPAIYAPVDSKRQAHACFVGQRYADRDRWVADLIRAGIPLVVFGPGWDGNRSQVAPGPKQESQYLGRPLRQAGEKLSFIEAAARNWKQDGLIAGTRRSWRQFQYRAESKCLAHLFADVARGPIPFDQQSAVFSESAVILNFSNVWADGRPGSKLIPHVRLRDFEAPMCRTCYLTGYTTEIEEFYEVGKEIDTYRSADELIEKTRFYLTNPEAAEQIRGAGYRRASQDHTWKQRFSELFNKLAVAA
jgi:spore maturation protein CgeB